jgi:hypothetical protein
MPRRKLAEISDRLLTSTAITRTPALGTSLRLPAGEFGQSRAIDRAAWASMVARARPLTGKSYTDRVTDLIDTILIPRARLIMSSEFNKDKLEVAVQQTLWNGDLDFARQTAERANAGDGLCHAALLCVAARLSRETPPEQPGYIFVRNYGEQLWLHPHRTPHKRRSGRPWTDNLMRDFEVCLIVALVCRDLGMNPTRNEATRTPSGISLVVTALKRHRIHLSETHVRKKLWDGPAGMMAKEAFGLAR